MKKIIMSLFVMLVTVTTVSAMPYQQAREQALFLTDKMAYELNLNDQQYEAAYEINLDYLMGVNTIDDVYAASWRQRNLDLQYVLLDWQYRTFCAASYFFRPLYWNAGTWHFAVYAHYPRHDFFYFSRPSCYLSYRGAHSWRSNGGSWYMHRVDHFRRPGISHVGMRDHYRPAPGRPVDMGNRRPVQNFRHNTTGSHTGFRENNNGSRPGFRENGTVTRPDNRDNNKGSRPGFRDNNSWQKRDDHRTYNRESSTRRTVTNGTGFRPSSGSSMPSNGGATRGNGSTFRGNSNGSAAGFMRR